MTEFRPDDADARFVAKWIEQRLRDAVQRLASAVRPLYELTANRHWKATATGTLLAFGERRVLVTAYHAIKPDHLVASVPAGPPVELDGKWSHSLDKQLGGRTVNDVDLAFLPLREDQAEAFKGCSWIGNEDWDAGARTDCQPSGGGQYILIGYPASRQTLKKKAVGAALVSSRHEHYVALSADESPNEKYEQLSRRQDHHLLLDFDRDEMWTASGKGLSPDLPGMSGGLVVRAHGYDESEPVQLRPVSIFIERKPSRRKHSYTLVSSRLGLLIPPLLQR